MEENNKIKIHYDYSPDEVIWEVNKCLKSKGLRFEVDGIDDGSGIETYTLISIATE